MASAPMALRLVARAASRQCPRNGARRGFKSSVSRNTASNYPMPALSPTMTEGNIASWRVKEGDSYSAGDVLLEIETDKATMDVEAQDDGILMKIVSPDGSKAIKVGQRIAVTAEPGDDINSLELPADNSQTDASKEAAKKTKPEPKEDADSKKKTGAAEAQPTEQPKQVSAGGEQGGKIHKQTYPLYPSVETLLHQNGLSEKDAEKIPASGPNGRLLKGDVLAYLGRITKDYPAKSSARIEKLSHLDLSNIQLAPKPEPKAAPQAAAAEPELPRETEIALPISLSSVIATQKRVQDTLGIFLPLSTFIARASELANDDLPVGKAEKPTADDLFNSVLGLDKVAKRSRGHFFPHITGLDPTASGSPTLSKKKPDIIDLLAPKTAKAKLPSRTAAAAVGISASNNIFSVTAKSGQEKRATEYLERLKYSLESAPGRLVL